MPHHVFYAALLLTMRLLWRVQWVRASVEPRFQGAVAALHLPPVMLARTSRALHWARQIRKWVVRTILLLAAISAFVLAAALLAEEVAPVQLPEVTWSNGDRTVIFEEMVHVGSPHFYDGVREDIRAAKAAGAAYLFEGVKPGKTADGGARLLSSMGLTTEPGVGLMDLYGMLSRATGLILQPQKSFVGLPGAADVNADVTLDQVYAKLDAMPAVERPQAAKAPDQLEEARNQAKQQEAIQKLARAVDAIDHMPQSEHQVVTHLLRNVASALIRMVLVIHPHNIIDEGTLLDWRNQVLADAILQGPKTVIVTYGAAHAPGVLADLQRADPRWHLVGHKERDLLR